MDSITVGLDIGSSAIRAAEVHATRDGRRVLRRYAQVGLPHGYVVDGEVYNVPGVSAALKRLWLEGGFSTNDVILGVSGPRVFVRQADVPALPPEELRSSLKFDAQEMVPISMEEASFDFSTLGPPSAPDGDGKRTQRILLVAAHRDLLRNYVATLKNAGLNPTVMDAAPLALMRAVPSLPSDRATGRVEILVSIGSDLTTVAVREDGVPRFIRSLTIGGARLTETIANSMHIEMAVAERLKRGAVPADTPQLAQARKSMTPEMRDLAEEVRATIDFFVSQSGGAEIERLLITGGASQTEGLALAVGGNLPIGVLAMDPLAQLDCSALGFSPEETARVSASGTTAIGLALWSAEAPLIRLSVLPEEVAAARRAARLAAIAGGSLVALVAVLGIAGAGEILAVHQAQSKVHAAHHHVDALNAEVARLQAATAVHWKAAARAGLDSSALQGDVDWVRVIGQLASAMPTDLSLQNLTGSRTVAAGSAASGTSTVGTMTMNVTGTGGLPAASSWLQGLNTDLDVTAVWIAGVNVKSNGGGVVFTSNATLTPTSESNRSAEVSK